MIGSTSYCLIRPEDKVVEIGWTLLTPTHRRTGANTEAKLRAAIASLPAQFEGIHRDDRLLRDGTRRSSAFHSVIGSECPAAKTALTDRMNNRTVG